MHFIIRKAQAADMPLLAAVELAAQPAFDIIPGYQHCNRTVPENILKEMANAGLLWVAVGPRQEIIGFAGCQEIDDFLYLHEISVAHDFQKQGVGRQLMQTILSYAETGSYSYIGLTTRRDARWNKPFYVSLGFIELGDEFLPALRRQLETELSQGADPAMRCAMIRSLTKR